MGIILAEEDSWTSATGSLVRYTALPASTPQCEKGLSCTCLVFLRYWILTSFHLSCVFSGTAVFSQSPVVSLPFSEQFIQMSLLQDIASPFRPNFFDPQYSQVSTHNEIRRIFLSRYQQKYIFHPFRKAGFLFNIGRRETVTSFSCHLLEGMGLKQTKNEYELSYQSMRLTSKHVLKFRETYVARTWLTSA